MMNLNHSSYQHLLDDEGFCVRCGFDAYFRPINAPVPPCNKPANVITTVIVRVTQTALTLSSFVMLFALTLN
jgi:hypothetical protein